MRTLLILSLLTLCPALCSAEDTHLLRYKFAAGEVLRYEVDQRSSVRSTIEGTTQEAQTKTVSLKAWKVIDVMPSGEIELINLVERVRMENKLPDRATMVFDSTSGEDPPPGFEDATKAVGVPLSAIQLSPRGKVIKRDVKHHQPAADPYETITLLLPEDPVAVGDSWTEPQEITVQLPEGGTKAIQVRKKHTLESVKTGVALIKTEFQALSPLTPTIEAQIDHRFITGELRFDIKRGRVLSQQQDVDNRVLGFAGPSSSKHLLSRMQEKLLDAEKEEVASRE